MIRNPAIPVSRISFRDGVVGESMLVSQAYPAYIHQSTPNCRPTWASPSGESVLTRTPVSWVTTKTKTRSKKSSRVVTR